MAGRPKTRARLQATTAAASQIPDAITEPKGNARTRADTPARARGFVGQGARGAVDAAAAGHLQDLARQLRIGTTVRIERIRPSWASGWLEDLTLSQGGYGELLEHLQEEYGGKKYRLTVLLPNGSPGFEATQDIAGPPLDEGSEVDRDEWNGQPGKRERERARERNAIPAAATTPTQGLDAVALVKLMLEMQAAGAERTERAMAQLATQNRETLQSVLQVREVERGPNLVEQLGELEQAKRALDRMGRVFGAADRPSGEAGADDVMSGAMKEATKHFLGNVLASEFAGKPGAGAPPQRPPVRAAPPQSGLRPAAPQRPQGVRPRPTRAHPSGIPDALLAGHKRAG